MENENYKGSRFPPHHLPRSTQHPMVHVGPLPAPIGTPVRNICSNCAEVAASRCVACFSAYYCSKACQVSDWCRHKGICKKLQTPNVRKLAESAGCNAAQFSLPTAQAALTALQVSFDTSHKKIDTDVAGNGKFGLDSPVTGCDNIASALGRTPTVREAIEINASCLHSSLIARPSFDGRPSTPTKLYNEQLLCGGDATTSGKEMLLLAYMQFAVFKIGDLRSGGSMYDIVVVPMAGTGHAAALVLGFSPGRRFGPFTDKVHQGDIVTYQTTYMVKTETAQQSVRALFGPNATTATTNATTATAPTATTTTATTATTATAPTATTTTATTATTANDATTATRSEVGDRMTNVCELLDRLFPIGQELHRNASALLWISPPPCKDNNDIDSIRLAVEQARRLVRNLDVIFVGELGRSDGSPGIIHFLFSSGLVLVHYADISTSSDGFGGCIVKGFWVWRLSPHARPVADPQTVSAAK
jgi:hypothetical protein